MNKLETRMVDILCELKDKHAAVSARAEFEAEGTRLEELLRLKEICMAAGLKLTLKIGGCESVRDMLEAKIVGVNCLVAPMVESAYALRKYIQAVNKVFSVEELKDIDIVCNVETITACNNFGKMLEIPEITMLKGVVVERVDLCFSLNKNEDSINDDDINQIALRVVKMAKNSRLQCAIGGGVSADSLPLFRGIFGGLLDFYETRKISFSCPQALSHDPENGFIKALAFEMLWLKNKSTFYNSIYEADQRRIALIEQRYPEVRI